eukprot:Nk52_evm36s153 gene=Nk52_evmTU36s153
MAQSISCQLTASVFMALLLLTVAWGTFTQAAPTNTNVNVYQSEEFPAYPNEYFATPYINKDVVQTNDADNYVTYIELGYFYQSSKDVSNGLFMCGTLYWKKGGSSSFQALSSYDEQYGYCAKKQKIKIGDNYIGGVSYDYSYLIGLTTNQDSYPGQALVGLRILTREPNVLEYTPYQMGSFTTDKGSSDQYQTIDTAGLSTQSLNSTTNFPTDLKTRIYGVNVNFGGKVVDTANGAFHNEGYAITSMSFYLAHTN